MGCHTTRMQSLNHSIQSLPVKRYFILYQTYVCMQGYSSFLYPWIFPFFTCADASARDADWIWLPELIPHVLQIPWSLRELLVPSGYCSCGVPYMREKRTVRFLLQEGRENGSLLSLGSAVATYLNCPSVTANFQSIVNCLFQERSVVLEFSFCSIKCLQLYMYTLPQQCDIVML